MTASAPTTSRPGTLRSGWRALAAAPDQVLVPTVVLSTAGLALHVALQYLIGLAVAGSTDCPRPYDGRVLLLPCGPTNARAQLALLVALLVLFVVGNLVVAGIYRAALGTASWARLGAVVVPALVLGFLLTLNTLFLVVPGIVFAFLSRYALLFVVDQGLGPWAALVASVRLVGSDLLGETGFVLRAFLLLLLGLLAFGIGLYVAVPVVLVAQMQRYRSRVPEPDAP